MNARTSTLDRLFALPRQTAPPIETVICAFQADLRTVASTFTGRLSKESAREQARAGRMGLKLMRDAVRAGRLIDFGETGGCSSCPGGTMGEVAHPFGDDTVAYSVAIPASAETRAGRFVFAFDPRRKLAAVAEVGSAEGWSWARWSATSIGDKVFAERHGLAELVNLACCGRKFASLAAVSILERTPFTPRLEGNCRCSRRGHERRSGYFRAYPLAHGHSPQPRPSASADGGSRP
jgi:hypothetical protein